MKKFRTKAAGRKHILSGKFNFILFITLLFSILNISIATPSTTLAANLDLTALEDSSNFIILPETATSTQADTVLPGNRVWNFFLGNKSQTSVSNAKVLINSGYTPTQFNNYDPVHPYNAFFAWEGEPAIASFPTLHTKNLVSPNEIWGSNFWSNIPDNYTLGYDSTRTVDPLIIPAGGGDQTVTITLTSRDPAKFTPPPVNVESNLFFIPFLDTHIPGVTVSSFTDPDNLNQGESLEVNNTVPGIKYWVLSNPQLNKTYTFKAVLHVPNPSSVPFEYRPSLNIRGSHNDVIDDIVPGSVVTIKDPTLDGAVPGSGYATFSVADTTHSWQTSHADSYDVIYDGTWPGKDVEQVSVMIKPVSKPPVPVNPKSQGVTPVAILSTDTFDAATIDPLSVSFGPNGAVVGSRHSHIEDVNGDGKPDMLFQFDTQQTGIKAGDTQACLTGKTTNGLNLNGCEAIRTVPSKI